MSRKVALLALPMAAMVKLLVGVLKVISLLIPAEKVAFLSVPLAIMAPVCVISPFAIIFKLPPAMVH